MNERLHHTPQEDAVAILERPISFTERAEPQGVTVAEAVEATLDHRGIAAPLMASEVEIASDNPSTLSRRERFYRSRAGRIVMSGLSALGLAAGGVVVEASPAYAANPVYTVVNPDKDNTRSIYDRNSPNWNDSNRKAPDFSYYGDRLELICGTNGEAIGPFNNKRWHYAKNLSRPEAGVTWIPDRYMNTPNKANQPTPGEAECGSAPASGGNTNTAPKIKACYFNMKAPNKNLTFSYEGSHRYLGNAYRAAQNWSDLGVGITIKSGTGNTYIKIKDVNRRNSKYAEAIVPDDWEGPLTSPPKSPHVPSTITIEANSRNMDPLSDYQRTYVLTHEIGHALGLAHSDAEGCDGSDKSIMKSGGQQLRQNIFNKPQQHDKLELKHLYGTS